MNEELLYVGPFAVQTSDWSLVPEAQQDWSFPLQPYADGSWLGWRSKDSALVHVDAQGLLLSPQQTQLPQSANPEWLLTRRRAQGLSRAVGT